MNTEPVIQTSKLSKGFNHVTVLKDINLTISKGQVVGFVGANGAGKSTLIRLITGIYVPDGGRCLTLGSEATKLKSEVLSRIGYVHQEGKLIGWMYVYQLIRFVAGHYPGRWNRLLESEFLERFDIPTGVKVSTLSPGKRQQLAILLAIGFEPELLILDEPAAGLDPLARFEFLQLMLDFIQSPDRTIIISSHILSDIEQVIDHVLIFKDGQIVRNCAFDELQEEFVQIQINAREGDRLPADLGFASTVYKEVYGTQALLVCRQAHIDLEEISERLNCDVIRLQLGFESIYRLVVSPQSFRHRPMELSQ